MTNDLVTRFQAAIEKERAAVEAAELEAFIARQRYQEKEELRNRLLQEGNLDLFHSLSKLDGMVLPPNRKIKVERTKTDCDIYFPKYSDAFYVLISVDGIPLICTYYDNNYRYKTKTRWKEDAEPSDLGICEEKILGYLAKCQGEFWKNNCEGIK